MADIRIKDLPAFTGDIPSNAMFAMETNAAAQKVALSALRNAIANVGAKTFTANGHYAAADDGLFGYNEADVDVANSYTAADEGKVVQHGALVSQTRRTLTENGTYNTTTNDEIVVEVNEGGAVKARLGTSPTIVELSGAYGPTVGSEDKFIIPVNDNDEVLLLDTTKPFEIQCAFSMTEAMQQVEAIILGSQVLEQGQTYHDLPLIYLTHGGSLCYNIYSGTRQDYEIAYYGYFTQEEFSLTLGTEATVRVVWDGTDLTLSVDDGSGVEATRTFEGCIPVSASNAVTCFGGGNGHQTNLTDVDGAYIYINHTYIKQDGVRVWGGMTGPQNLTDLTVNQDGVYNPPAGYDGFNQVVVAVSSVLAKLGSDPTVVTLGNYYGPLGDYQDDYITPVSASNGENVILDTTKAYDIKVTFKLTALPTSRVAIFGSLDAENDPMPAMMIDANGTDIRYKLPVGTGAQPSYAEGTIINESGYALPLNSEISVMASFDGTDTWDFGVTVGSEDYVDEVSGSAPWAEDAPLAIATNGGGADGLAGVSGAVIVIGKTYIKQSGTYLWRLIQGGIVVVPLTVTQNGTYTPESGTAYGPVTVSVGGDRCPRSEQTTTLSMDDFYDTFTFTVTAEEGTL